MQDVLSDYLNDAATPEMRDALVAAHNSLERMSLPNYEEGFIDLLMIDDETDEGGTLESIVKLTKSLQFQILQQHEIVLNEDTTLDMLTLFINGILDITEYDDKIIVRDTASLGGLPEEVLAELMALVSGRTVEELLFEISHVSASLIARIKEMVSDAQPPAMTEDEQVQVQQHLTLLNRLCGLANTRELDVVKMITKANVSVGMPFAVYADAIGRNLEAMSPVKAANELLGMALISSDGWQTPRAVIKENIEHYISNIDNITKIDIEIGKLLLGLQL